MKSQSDIFSLIKSLNGPEKRYFKIYAKRNSLKGKSNYITLFNLIDRQKEPDEKKLKLLLKKSNPNFGLAETKYQLQNIILKSLVAFYSESKPLLRINQMRSRIAILISKSLFKQSIVLIEKLKKESIAIGNFALVIDLISFERDVAYAMFSFGILDKKLTIWYEEQQHATNLLVNLNEFLHAHTKLMHMFFKIGTVRNPTELKQVNALIKLKVLSSEKFALTPWAKFWYHYSHKIHAWIIRDYNKLIYHCDEVLQVFLQNKELKRAHYVHYLQALEHRARTLVHMHNEGEAKEALRALSNEMIHQRKNASTEEFFKWFNASAETELWYYHVFALYADGEKHIAVLEKELKELNKRSGRNYELPTPFCIACIYFGNKKYKKAITWLHKIINVSESEERLDIQVLSRILLLLCIFEMKDWDYLANQWGAVYRFLAKKKRLYKIESILLDCIRQSLKFHSSDQFKKMFQRLRSEIILLKKDYFEKIIFEYFDFEAWLISKTESITFEEAVRNQNKMY